MISCVLFVRTGSETKYGQVACRTPFNNYFVLCHGGKRRRAGLSPVTQAIGTCQEK
ncbi:protein of unknown function [Paraburkholderia dioscoreae]|uniref:Uncharacterized protein n=1 Tax=Paraburkholderia dioscoreae TaxID=2604047 RepID=A0A5Q4YYG3_9BURK|nr:protein of unknown function [Paraburkholderia dioscoreae]